MFPAGAHSAPYDGTLNKSASLGCCTFVSFVANVSGYRDWRRGLCPTQKINRLDSRRSRCVPGSIERQSPNTPKRYFPTSSYVFESAAAAAARFSGEQPGNIYSRFTNPTVRCFEERLAALEGGERCVATASGMSAIYATCAGLLQAGDQIVSSRSLFGSTTLLFTNYLHKFGVENPFCCTA